MTIIFGGLRKTAEALMLRSPFLACHTIALHRVTLKVALHSATLKG
jgi:hypothetical protein